MIDKTWLSTKKLRSRVLSIGDDLSAIEKNRLFNIAVTVVWGSVGSYETIWSLHGMSLVCDTIENKDLWEELSFLSDLASAIFYNKKMLEIEDKYHAI